MVTTPAQFLAMVLLATAAAGLIRVILRRRHVQRLRGLAAQWKMHFSADDRFRLATKIAPRLPVPGAAGIRVEDLLYGIENQNYRYIFAAEYTTGVLRTKTGVRRVATFCEPRDATEPGFAASSCNLEFAPDGMSIVEQYRHLLQKCNASGDEMKKR
jgi:hypothetical protein